MNSLLPPGSTPLERRLAQTCSGISDLQVPLRDLWNPATCPVSFLPYLAWAFSVDRWDEGWTESVKRQVVKDAFYIHQAVLAICIPAKERERKNSVKQESLRDPFFTTEYTEGMEVLFIDKPLCPLYALW